MATVYHETENAILYFDLREVRQYLGYHTSEYEVDEAATLSDFLSSKVAENIKIPDEYGYFGTIAIELISGSKGSVYCKVCWKTYQPDQLKSIVVGHGKDPFSVNLKEKGGIKKLFKRKPKLPGMHGGKGYECPERHELKLGVLVFVILSSGLALYVHYKGEGSPSDACSLDLNRIRNPIRGHR